MSEPLSPTSELPPVGELQEKSPAASEQLAFEALESIIPEIAIANARVIFVRVLRIFSILCFSIIEIMEAPGTVDTP